MKSFHLLEQRGRLVGVDRMRAVRVLLPLFEFLQVTELLHECCLTFNPSAKALISCTVISPRSSLSCFMMNGEEPSWSGYSPA